MTRADFRVIQRSMDGRYAVERKFRIFGRDRWRRLAWDDGDAWFDSLDLAIQAIDVSIRVAENTESVVWVGGTVNKSTVDIDSIKPA